MRTATRRMTALIGPLAMAAATVLPVLADAAVASPISMAHSSDSIVARSLPMPGSGERRMEGAAVAHAPRGCHNQPRAEVDRPDIVEGPSIHVVYLVAADSPDQLLDANGTLTCTIAAQNQWIEQQSGLRWNFDMFTYPRQRNGRTRMSRAVDVTFARSELPAAELGGAVAVRDELRRLGFIQTEKRYLTYVMGQYTTYCGDAIYPLSPHADDRDGIYAQVYLSSANVCNAQRFGRPGAPSWSDAIAQQELLHTEGLAPIGAPRSCPMVLPYAHVCTAALFYAGDLASDPEQVDLMYPYASAPLSEKVLDRGHDDYFDHNLPLADLADSSYLISGQD